jgi:hypothetical protein
MSQPKAAIPLKYTDVMKPEQISVAFCWEVYRAYVVPANASAEQVQDTRMAFYAGFSECFKIMVDLTDSLTEDHAADTLSRINTETRAFYEDFMAKHTPAIKSKG